MVCPNCASNATSTGGRSDLIFGFVRFLTRVAYPIAAQSYCATASLQTLKQVACFHQRTQLRSTPTYHVCGLTKVFCFPSSWALQALSRDTCVSVVVRTGLAQSGRIMLTNTHPTSARISLDQMFRCDAAGEYGGRRTPCHEHKSALRLTLLAR